jgi:hypothetical protein
MRLDLLATQTSTTPPEEASPVTSTVASTLPLVLTLVGGGIAVASLGRLIRATLRGWYDFLVATEKDAHAWGQSIHPSYDNPWPRHGRLLTDLPITPASAAVPGELIAVSGRVEGGSPVTDSTAEAPLVMHHLLLDDGSGTRIHVGRPGSTYIRKRFAIGDLVFAIGQVERSDHIGHPFRNAEPSIRLLPGADELLFVARCPRDQACAALFEEEANRRARRRNVRFLIPAALIGLVGMSLLFVFGGLQLAIFGKSIWLMLLSIFAPVFLFAVGVSGYLIIKAYRSSSRRG